MTTTSLEIGDRAPDREIGPITRTDIVRFAGAGGDFNPMHHDEEFAKAAGMPGVFAMGQMQAAMLAGFAATWLGRERIRRYAVRFTGQVWPGDILHLGGEVIAIEERAGERVAECRLWAERDEGERVIEGTATALLDR